MNVRRLLIVAVVVMRSVIAHAQWIDQRSPNTPRLPDGTPNLAAPVPRAIDGPSEKLRFDISDVYRLDNNGVLTLERSQGSRTRKMTYARAAGQ